MSTWDPASRKDPASRGQTEAMRLASIRNFALFRVTGMPNAFFSMRVNGLISGKTFRRILKELNLVEQEVRAKKRARPTTIRRWRST